jgi:hypothetical protein
VENIWAKRGEGNRKMKKKTNIIRSFIICTLQQISLGWLNEGVWTGHGRPEQQVY